MNSEINGNNGIYSYASFGNKPAPKRNRFLWWCAGAHISILEKYPSEHSKFTGLGALVLTTFVLAALAGGYAFYTVFNNVFAAIFFGLLWGTIIFNFDRFLVSTMRKYGVSESRQFWLALPRIVLAVLIGFTIARPLELKIFEKEVEVKVIDNMHHKIQVNDSLLAVQYHSANMAAAEERNRLGSRKFMLEDTLYKLQQAYIQEADGTGGSGRRGIEGLTRLKMDAFRAASDQYYPEISLLASQIAYQDSLMETNRSAIAKESEAYKASLEANVGFLERNKALSDLQDEESSVFWAALLISLLIIIIETGPVIAKLIMPKGPYDIALGSEELLNMAKEEEIIRQKKHVVYDKNEIERIRKKELTEEYLTKLTELQKREFEKILSDWEKGNPAEKPRREQLDELLADFKKQYQYKEENIL